MYLRSMCLSGHIKAFMFRNCCAKGFFSKIKICEGNYIWKMTKIMRNCDCLVNISINSVSNLTTKDSFRISFSSGFWNCPWLLHLIKKWQRYWQSKRRLPFTNWPLFYFVRCINALIWPDKHILPSTNSTVAQGGHKDFSILNIGLTIA